MNITLCDDCKELMTPTEKTIKVEGADPLQRVEMHGYDLCFRCARNLVVAILANWKDGGKIQVREPLP